MQYIRDGLLVKPIVVQVPSRVSLVGNPSDLLGQAEARAKKKQLRIPADGAVLSMPVWSLSASVSLLPSTEVEIIAPRSKFKTWAEYVSAVKERGIGDWEHIIDKTADVLGDMHDEVGVPASNTAWSIHLDTNIPRQRGVSGSSGMILAFMQATLIAHGIERRFSVIEKAVKVLSVETALGVSAGLQDRILQSVALSDPNVGAVFMDFSRDARDQSCRFTAIDEVLPEMALILSDQPSHSGAIHEPIIKWLIAGDSKLQKQFHALGNLARVAKSYVLEHQWDALGGVMTKSAEARIEIYGEDVLGPINMALVAACRAAECPFNFTGSGGAVVAMLPARDSFRRLKAELAKSGKFTVYRLKPKR